MGKQTVYQFGQMAIRVPPLVSGKGKKEYYVEFRKMEMGEGGKHKFYMASFRCFDCPACATGHTRKEAKTNLVEHLKELHRRIGKYLKEQSK